MMKKSSFIILILAVFFTVSCNNEKRGNLSTDVITNPNSASGDSENNLPVIEFDKEIHDFGKLIQGEKATYNFKFTNTGKSDLVITNVKSSCGCTVPKYPREAIKPGEEGKIKVTFNSAGEKGMKNKMITISTNCQPPNFVIRVKAQVITP